MSALTFENIASAQSKASSSKASVIAQRPTTNGITLAALVLTSVNKGWNKDIKTTVHSYQVLVLDTGRAASHTIEADRGGLISRPLPEEEKGFRLVRANGTTNAKTRETYRNVNIAYNNAYDHGDNGRTDKVINKNTRDTPRGKAIDYSLETPLLSKWTELTVATGQARYFDVRVGEQDVLIPRGRLVKLRGVTVDLFASTPKKAAGTVPAEGVAVEEDGGADEGFASNDTIEHLRDATSGNTLGFKLRCDVIFETDQSESYGKLPTDRLYRVLLDVCKQQPEYLKPGEFGRPNKCLVLSVDAKGLDESKAVATGIIIGANNPSRFIKETMKDVDANSPETYEWGKAGATLNCLPVHASLIHYHRAPKQLSAEESAELSERFAEEAPEGNGTDNVVYFNKANVDSIIWSSQTYSSGVTDPALWRDVNAQARIPCIVIAKPTRYMVHESALKMKVLAVAWRTKEYVLQHSFEVPLAFAREILGGKDATTGKVEFGKEQAANGRPELFITNESNKTRGHVDLLNATESAVDLTPYLDSAKKWHARVQLVTNTLERASANERQQKRVAELVEKTRLLKTPEEGQRFIEEYIANKHAGEMELQEFGSNQKTHRVIVWFVRHDEDVYTKELFSLPPLVDLSPPPPLPATTPMVVDEQAVVRLKRPLEEGPREEPEAKKARKE
jgi:hypothetical protein